MARNNSIGVIVTDKPKRGDNILGKVPGKPVTNTDRPQGLPGLSFGDTSNAPTVGGTILNGSFGTLNPIIPPNAPTVGGAMKPPEEEKNPYLEYLEEFENQMNSMAEAYRQQLAKMYADQSGIINDQYDKSANTAYIQYKQNQRDLPESLSSAGITGGATESANIKLQSAYGNNLAENENERNNDLFSAKQGYDEMGSDYQRQLNSQLASAYQQAHQMAAAWEDEQRAKKEAAAKEAAAKAEQQALAERNNKIRREELALNRQGKITENWYDETGRYRWQVVGTNKSEAKKQAAANQALLEQSMALADQGYNVGIKDGAIYTSSKKKLTGGSSYGGSSGGSRSYYSSGGSGAGSSLPPVKKKQSGNNEVYKRIEYSIGNAFVGQMSEKAMKAKRESFAKQIAAANRSGDLTDAQAKKLMNLMN